MLPTRSGEAFGESAMTKVEEFRNKWLAHCKECDWVGVPRRNREQAVLESQAHDLEHMEKELG